MEVTTSLVEVVMKMLSESVVLKLEGDLGTFIWRYANDRFLNSIFVSFTWVHYFSAQLLFVTNGKEFDVALVSLQDVESGNSLFVQSLRGDPFRVSFLLKNYCACYFLIFLIKKIFFQI